MSCSREPQSNDWRVAVENLLKSQLVQPGWAHTLWALLGTGRQPCGSSSKGRSLAVLPTSNLSSSHQVETNTCAWSRLFASCRSFGPYGQQRSWRSLLPWDVLEVAACFRRLEVLFHSHCLLSETRGG